ncbi:hypothetical protein [Planomicrobium sp. CPCC 101110]|uniref:hypothetical protein n=1 Tax=Planomicrobium sp. CPCC 101110 TaxID=2599619 RepID=UPI0011B7D1A1|nr:hypothetical protein [Planomicrobium sp. CPCC 101110]TWT25971.1 hypothetical protein FQV30_09270 [Planomicrobium sp. CPCC 101110]
MTNESIKALLVTICQYNTVRITQTFSKDDMDWIRVRCLPGTSILELTYLQSENVETYDSVDEAAAVIEKALYSHVTV